MLPTIKIWHNTGCICILSYGLILNIVVEQVFILRQGACNKASFFTVENWSKRCHISGNTEVSNKLYIIAYTFSGKCFHFMSVFKSIVTPNALNVFKNWMKVFFSLGSCPLILNMLLPNSSYHRDLWQPHTKLFIWHTVIIEKDSRKGCQKYRKNCIMPNQAFNA